MKKRIFILFMFLGWGLVCLWDYSEGGEQVSRIKIWESKMNWETCTKSLSIDLASEPDTVKLVPTELLTDEIGNTVSALIQTIGKNVWVKKEFVLPQSNPDKAVLLVHRPKEFVHPNTKVKNIPLIVDVNGKVISHICDINRLLTGSWDRIDIPVEYLKKGLNEFVFHGDHLQTAMFTIENSRFPNRSARSIDGGKTWDYDLLGDENYCDGEFLIRLRLGWHPENGHITSDFIDAGGLIAGANDVQGYISPLFKLTGLNLVTQVEQPEGSEISWYIRGGTTPSYCPDSWESWQSLNFFTEKNRGKFENWRYIQWEGRFKSNDRKVTPKLHKVELQIQAEVERQPGKEPIVIKWNNNPIIRSSFPFAYQKYEDPRLGILKERHNLDMVVGEAATEFDKFILLRDWVRSQWHWSKGNVDYFPTPWDALVALEMVPQGKGLGYCEIYNMTFVQCCLAVGLNARDLVLDHHHVAEVWSNEYKKWILMDAAASVPSTRNVHYLRNGVPLSALEFHNAVIHNELDKIMVIPRPPFTTFTADKSEAQGLHKGINEWYNRFSITFRNNYLTSVLPQALQNGLMPYQYDGFLWWKDSPIPAYEEYSLQTDRSADFYWTLNQARIYLMNGKDDGVLDIQVDTFTPNFKTFLVSLDGGPWYEKPASFQWILHAGDNSLKVKPVNKWDLDGTTSEVMVRY